MEKMARVINHYKNSNGKFVDYTKVEDGKEPVFCSATVLEWERIIGRERMLCYLEKFRPTAVQMLGFQMILRDFEEAVFETGLESGFEEMPENNR